MEQGNKDDAKITFCTEQGETQEMIVFEQTRISGVNYLLVSPQDDDVCYILKDVSEESDEQSTYVEIEDEVEYDAVAKVFEELLEDEYDFEVE